MGSVKCEVFSVECSGVSGFECIVLIVKCRV